MPARCDFPRVELQGSQLDLENLAAILHEGYHRVRVEEGMYWLRSGDFDGLACEPDKTRLKAVEVLSLLNGVAKTYIPDFHPVELGQCVDWIRQDGRAKRRLTATITVHTRSGARVATSTDSGVIDEIESLTSLSKTQVEVRDVLRLWGTTHAHDWSTLYKVKEQIEAAVGKQISSLGWATNAELRRFDHTANSPAVLGHAARHGVQTSDPPQHPMTLVEAQELVERLVRSWIKAQI